MVTLNYKLNIIFGHERKPWTAESVKVQRRWILSAHLLGGKHSLLIISLDWTLLHTCRVQIRDIAKPGRYHRKYHHWDKSGGMHQLFIGNYHIAELSAVAKDTLMVCILTDKLLLSLLQAVNWTFALKILLLKKELK